MRILWKIYFVLFVGLLLIAVTTMPMRDTTTSLTYVDLIVSLPSLVALYGWAWRKKIGARGSWLAYAPLFLIVDVVYNLFLSRATMNSAGNAAAGFVLVAPCYVASVLYALRFDEIAG